MKRPRPIPINFKPLYEGVTFVLKDLDGHVIEDKIFPCCSDFSKTIALRTFAACSGVMDSDGLRYAVLEVIGRNHKVRQRIAFDAQLYREWRDSL